MNIDEAITETFRREGTKYENVPGDSGGPTKFGVTLGDLKMIRGEATWEDVRDLTAEEAREIYKTRFYRKPKIDLLPDGLQAVVFDHGVLSGPSAAIKLLQEVLVGNGYDTEIDGVMGPQTVRQAFAAWDEFGAELVNAYTDSRINFFKRLAERRPKDQKFLKGWLNRANEFRV